MIRSRCARTAAAVLLLVAWACAPSDGSPRRPVEGAGGAGGDGGGGGQLQPGGDGGGGGTGGAGGDGGGGGAGGEKVSSTVFALEGLSGLADVPYQLVAGGDGSLWIPGYRSVVAFRPDETTWTLELDLPLMGSRTLAAGPSGVVHLLAEVGSELAWFRRPPDGAWKRMPKPPAPHEGFRAGAAASPDGRFCFGALLASSEWAVHCAGEDGVWGLAAVAPEGESLTAVGFDAEGQLLFSTWERNLYELSGASPHRVFEGFHASGFVAAPEAVYAYGEGVLHRPSGGAWVDVSAGLPEGCSTRSGRCAVFDLAVRGEDVFAIGSQGLYRRRGDGAFEHVAPIPPHENVGAFQAGLLERDGTILVPSSHGIWRLREASGDWELVTRGGVEFGRFPLAVGFLPDGGEAFAAGSFSNDFNRVYRRRPEDLHWTQLDSEEPLPVYHDVVDLAVRADGALLFGTERLNAGAGDRGLLFVAEPGADRYARPSLDRLPAWNPDPGRATVNLVGVGWLPDGSAVVAIDVHGVYRLPPDATTWERLGPDVNLAGLWAHRDGRILVAAGERVLSLSGDTSEWTPVHAPLPALIRHLVADDEGTLWVATAAGVFREEDGAFVRVGEGACAASANAVFAGAGRAYCLTATGHVAELVDGRWVRIPGLGPDAHHVRPVAIDPEGRLYLLFGHSPRAALVRTRT